MRRMRRRRGFGLGRLFGLLFLVRHPIFLLVFVLIALAIYLYRRRR